MSYQLPPLNWLRAFEAAARHNSFTAAAGELNLTPAAVSHQVRSLEEHLGFAMFVRLPRSLRLTDLGSAYLPSVRKAFSDLSVSTTGLFGITSKGALTVRCNSSFGILWLAPRLSRFLEAYPNVELRFYNSVWADPVSVEKIDIDIRYGVASLSSEPAQTLFQESILALCSQSCIDRHGKVEAVADFLHQPLIHLMGVEDSWARVLGAAGVDEAPPQHIRADNSLAAMEMACQGTGHTLVFKSYVEKYLAEGRLVRSIDREFETEQSHYVVLPAGAQQPRPEVLVFREWLLDEARASGSLG